MKKAAALFFCLLLFVFPALAEEPLSRLEVVNCEEWVSLRAEEDTHAERLAKVPLGERVTLVSDPGGDFYECSWKGQTGFILKEYLFPVSTPAPEGEAWSGPGLDSAATLMLSGTELYSDGVWCVKTLRDDEGGERLRIACFKDGAPVWGYTLLAPAGGQFQQTEAFIAGSAAQPVVMAYNAGDGLMQLDLQTGAERWKLSREECSLGGGIAWAADGDGTVYITGYDAGGPVAIGAEGGVLWRSGPGNDEIYWPYSLTISGDGLFTEYERGPEGGGHYAVTYDLYTGAVLKTEIAMW